MDQEKFGLLLRTLRLQKHMTQKNLADVMGLSHKTISKWECGQGCPDLSVLPELAAILGISMEDLLSGQLPEQDKNGGNMKNLKFYVCPRCGNVVTASGSPSLSCCGRVLEPLVHQKPDAAHSLNIEEIDGEWFLTSPHPMTKSHSLMFAALVTSERITLVRQWPEWDFQLRLPKRGHGILYWYCTEHGLFRELL
ncbi:MAG: helix-turn-helix domain-containing protein [Ruminococcaceae bacterium]|nr:helix-turn-helix domain-containing protein [Oscillospiraceae bacterium]